MPSFAFPQNKAELSIGHLIAFFPSQSAAVCVYPREEQDGGVVQVAAFAE